jgi:hypothetical protein
MFVICFDHVPSTLFITVNKTYYTVKKELNGRKSLRRLKPTVGCNASKRRRRNILYNIV